MVSLAHQIALPRSVSNGPRSERARVIRRFQLIHAHSSGAPSITFDPAVHENPFDALIENEGRTPRKVDPLSIAAVNRNLDKQLETSGVYGRAFIHEGGEVGYLVGDVVHFVKVGSVEVAFIAQCEKDRKSEDPPGTSSLKIRNGTLSVRIFVFLDHLDKRLCKTEVLPEGLPLLSKEDILNSLLFHAVVRELFDALMPSFEDPIRRKSLQILAPGVFSSCPYFVLGDAFSEWTEDQIRKMILIYKKYENDHSVLVARLNAVILRICNAELTMLSLPLLQKIIPFASIQQIKAQIFGEASQ